MRFFRLSIRSSIKGIWLFTLRAEENNIQENNYFLSIKISDTDLRVGMQLEFSALNSDL